MGLLSRDAWPVGAAVPRPCSGSLGWGRWGAWIPAFLAQPASLHSPQPIPLPLGGLSLREAPLEGVKASGVVWPYLCPGGGLVPSPPPPKMWSSEDMGYTGQTEQMDKLERGKIQVRKLQPKLCFGEELPSLSHPRGSPTTSWSSPLPRCPFHSFPGTGQNHLPENFFKAFPAHKKWRMLSDSAQPPPRSGGGRPCEDSIC